MRYRLDELRRFFDGIVPATIATCSAEGVPNVTFLSQVHYLDERHVALSRQFFNKTTRNILENPRASICLMDPLSFEKVLLDTTYVRSETNGELFEAMSTRINAIASHTGMTGIFKLLAVDVFEVLEITDVCGEVQPPAEPPPNEELWGNWCPAALDHRRELYTLQRICGRVTQTRSVEALCRTLLDGLAEELGFRHARVLIPDCDGLLVVRASNGFGEAAIGRRLRATEGLFGTVVQEKRLLRLNRIDDELRYVRTVKERVQSALPDPALQGELPLPGLPNARSHLIVPLVARDHLTAIVAIEDPNPLAIERWHEAFLAVLGNQVAIALEQLIEDERTPVPTVDRTERSEALPAPVRRRPLRRLLYYRGDECMFADGEYLIGGVPAKILWKVLTEHRRDGRREFTNRELRLDASLGLPELRDNLEARLVLLRKRLAQRCPEIQLTPAGRGRFALELGGEVELSERETA